MSTDAPSFPSFLGMELPVGGVFSSPSSFASAAGAGLEGIPTAEPIDGGGLGGGGTAATSVFGGLLSGGGTGGALGFFAGGGGGSAPATPGPGGRAPAADG
jgi:hypothetical protein